jgi:catechol 2,3-dioxygenase
MHDSAHESANMTSIDPTARIGAVHLIVRDLARSIAFYEERLGMRVHAREGRVARLGAGGDDLLVLHEDPSARTARGTTGLYHFAVLVPSRRDLAHSLARLAATRTPLQGAADHGVSEALYLADPDENGIEIYRDRPRAEWPFANGRLAMTTDPLDLEDLIAERSAEPLAALDPATTIGHVHLHGADLAAAERFYVGVLGFALMQRYGSGAIFVSAGGYHHHVGLNTWQGVGAPPPPAGATGLRHFEIVLPDRAALDAVERRLRAASIHTERDGESVIASDPSKNVALLRTPATP